MRTAQPGTAKPYALSSWPKYTPTYSTAVSFSEVVLQTKPVGLETSASTTLKCVKSYSTLSTTPLQQRAMQPPPSPPPPSPLTSQEATAVAK